MKSYGSAFVAGTLFGLGLAVSQMINPEKVLAFLDVAGNWDASLILVMGAAVAVASFGYRQILRRTNPLFEPLFQLPKSRRIDAQLLVGAVVFGVGWGMAGYCPGPGIAALTLVYWEPVVFLAACLAGSFLTKWAFNR